jgi:uncharacterized protein (TIGR00375 family)
MNNPISFDKFKMIFQDKEAFFADFHIHSRFSRATSKKMNPTAINDAAKLKGLKVVGTGDITHPEYLKELKDELIPDGNGLYVCKNDPSGTKFVLTGEVSNIFTQVKKNRRIHTVIFLPDFEVAEDIQARLSSIGNIKSDGRPIFGFSAKDLVRIVMDASPECLILPAHIWTPWFSLFGANSGFDSVEECFEEESAHIHCLETGLSSDPMMNFRLSALDRYTLLSNSDAHSPSKLGRESNCFSCPLSYSSIISAIKDPSLGFEGTVEFFPEEGKYHYDGHRSCNVSLHPEESIRLGNICPVCKNPLTIGVFHRIEELADRKEDYVPPHARPCAYLVPLEEIVAEAMGVQPGSQKVAREYRRLVRTGGNELNILLFMDMKELSSLVSERLLYAIKRMRDGRVKKTPGYDGVYGKISLLSEEKKKERPIQRSLF